MFGKAVPAQHPARGNRREWHVLEAHSSATSAHFDVVANHNHGKNGYPSPPASHQPLTSPHNRRDPYVGNNSIHDGGSKSEAPTFLLASGSDSKFDLLFRVFDPGNTGRITKEQIESQFQESISENGFSVEEHIFNLLVEFLMNEFDPDRTGEIRRDQMFAAMHSAPVVQRRIKSIRMTPKSVSNRTLSHSDESIVDLTGEIALRESKVNFADPPNPSSYPYREMEDIEKETAVKPSRRTKRVTQKVEFSSIEELSRPSRLSVTAVSRRRMLQSFHPSQMKTWEMKDDDDIAAPPALPRTRRERFGRFLFDNRVEIMWCFVWVMFNLFAIGVAWAVAIFQKKETFKVLSYGAPIAFSGKYMTFLNAPLALLFMCRSFWTWISGTSIGRILPVESRTKCHIVLAYGILLGALLHCGGHFYNFYVLSHTTVEKLNSVLSNANFKSVPNYLQFLFLTIPGFSGIVITLSLLLIFTTSISKKLRSLTLFYFVCSYRFELWWAPHHFFIPFYAALCVHGVKRYLAPIPMFWIFFMIPALWYFLERMQREFTRCTNGYADVLSMKEHAGSVLYLVFRKPNNFHFRAGQYLFLNCADVSHFEWHPFTITSSPLEDTLSVHIRKLGNWTGNLLALAHTSLLRDISGTQSNDAELRFLLDGGYGAPCERVNDFEVVMLIGAGIGMTPFAAIAKDIHLQQQRGFRPRAKKVYLFWLNREQAAFEWFAQLFCEIEERDSSAQVFQIHTYVTSATAKHDPRHFFLRMAMDLYFQRYKHDVLTKLKSFSHWGRPKWPKVFHQIRQQHNSAEPIGVFCCGPPALAKELKSICESQSNITSGHFVFYREQFGL